MKALVIHQFGDPNQIKLEEVPTPEPREDEVLVAIQGAAIRPMPLSAVAEAYTQAAPGGARIVLQPST